MFQLKAMFLATILLLAAAASPAHAEPVTGAITAIGFWYSTIGLTGQLLVQVGIGVALAAASYGLQYLLSATGQRQQQGRQETPGTQLPEFDPLLEARRCYGTVALAGGLFVAGGEV